MRNTDSEFWTTLVLAGSREGGHDFGAGYGAGPKAMIPVAGVPMLARVLATLLDEPRVQSLVVCTPDAAPFRAVAALAGLMAEPRVDTFPTATSPSRSVGDFLQTRGDEDSVLVTTSDHPLLTPRMVGYFLDHAARAEADVCVGVVPADILRQRYPEQKRTYIKLGADEFCGANLFSFRGRRGRLAAQFWERAEAHRKQPWKLVRAFGLGAVARFLTGRLDRAGAFELASDAIGARIVPIDLPFPEAAIDVDKPEDLVAAESILVARGLGPA